MGLMRQQAGGPLTGGDDAFFVTDAGKKVALDGLPKLSRSQERYRRWLDVADVTNQSFGDYLKAGCAQ
jgi:hypothetical protein